MPKPTHSRQSKQPSQPRQPVSIPDSVTPIPTVEQIYKQRKAIDALSLEIENDQKLFAEQSAEKKKRLREFQVELSTAIRQTNAALQQLAVPVTSDNIPEPLIEPAPVQNNTAPLNIEPANVLPLSPDVPSIPVLISPPITPAPAIQPAPTPSKPVTGGYSPLFIMVVICVLFFATLTYCSPKPDPSPTPDPIVITTADQIIKEVESQTLTHNEKIVEATRRLVQEANMERDEAYKYATKEIKNIPNAPPPSNNPPLFNHFPHFPSIKLPKIECATFHVNFLPIRDFYF